MNNMKKDSKIYVAGHKGLVGSALVRRLEQDIYSNLLLRTHKELDLLNQAAVESFFKQERPEYIFLAAAKPKNFPNLPSCTKNIWTKNWKRNLILFSF